MISVVIPVHNEAKILDGVVSRIVDRFRQEGLPFELVLCENGSTDATPEILRSLCRIHPEVRVERLAMPNYGLALRRAFEAARYEFVAFFTLEFWDVDFLKQALEKLKTYELVIGSKRARGGGDERALLRRLITLAYNRFLQFFFRFQGTDTHGMKVFRREILKELLPRCVCDGFVFETEFVLRAQRMAIRGVEIPVRVPWIPSEGPFALLKRVPGVLRNLYRLKAAFWKEDALGRP